MLIDPRTISTNSQSTNGLLSTVILRPDTERWIIAREARKSGDQEASGVRRGSRWAGRASDSTDPALFLRGVGHHQHWPFGFEDYLLAVLRDAYNRLVLHSTRPFDHRCGSRLQLPHLYRDRVAAPSVR
jgi:hypothetical protein